MRKKWDILCGKPHTSSFDAFGAVNFFSCTKQVLQFELIGACVGFETLSLYENMQKEGEKRKIVLITRGDSLRRLLSRRDFYLSHFYYNVTWEKISRFQPRERTFKDVL